MNKKSLFAMTCAAFAALVLTTNTNAQVVVFSNDFEDSDLTAEIGSMTLVADSATPSIVPVTGAPDATNGNNVVLLDQGSTTLDLTLNLTDTLSLADGNTVSLDFDVAARRTDGFTKTIYVDAMDSNGNIVVRLVIGDSNAFGNGGADRQRPGYATLAGGNLVFGGPPGSFWWGSDFNSVEFDALKDSHMSLTIGDSSFDFFTTQQGNAANPFSLAGVINYDAVTSANIAEIRITSAGVNYGMYFDNLKVEGVVADVTDVLLGDVNLDGVVDFLDISPFITLLSAGGFQAEADCDLSTVVDFLDISPFIEILSQ